MHGAPQSVIDADRKDYESKAAKAHVNFQSLLSYIGISDGSEVPHVPPEVKARQSLRYLQHMHMYESQKGFMTQPTFLKFGTGLGRARQFSSDELPHRNPLRADGRSASATPLPVVVTEMPKKDDRPNVVNLGGVTVNVQTNASPTAIAGAVGPAVGSAVSNALSDIHH
jgi:hypothetical protein